MDPIQNATAAATPPMIASSITGAWFRYFLVVTVVGIVLSTLISGVFAVLVRSMGGNPIAMRVAVTALSIAVNAPVSFLVFQWAVRRKVVPSVLAWAAGADSTQA